MSRQSIFGTVRVLSSFSKFRKRHPGPRVRTTGHPVQHRNRVVSSHKTTGTSTPEGDGVPVSKEGFTPRGQSFVPLSQEPVLSHLPNHVSTGVRLVVVTCDPVQITYLFLRESVTPPGRGRRRRLRTNRGETWYSGWVVTVEGVHTVQGRLFVGFPISPRPLPVRLRRSGT